jgi:ornithine cyclodeaminase/alanine dehydrogenase-like protein (mu-crystallin family)
MLTITAWSHRLMHLLPSSYQRHHAMKNNQILYLTRAEMESVGPSFTEVVELLEIAFRLKGQGKAVNPPKHWLERAEDRFFSAMSSSIEEIGFAGCKWQSGDPANSSRGLPYIQGIYVLTEGKLGIPVALMDSEWITGRRTAAASALAVKYLAAADASTLAILGCGLQGRAHLRAIRGEMPGLRRVQVFDVRPDAAHAFVREFASEKAFEIVVANGPKAAVKGADVVVSGGPIMTPPKPVIEVDWLKQGVLGVSIDYDSYWTAGAMQSMSLITTDDQQQIEHLKEYGLFLAVPRLDCELAEIVAGTKSGRTAEGQNILCFNLGIAIEDLVTAVDVYKRASAESVGTILPR